MTRIATFCLAALLIGGCRAPMPSFDVFAPYGSSRVPPPSTGTYGAANAYYPGQGTGAATSPATIPTSPLPRTTPNLGGPAPVGSSISSTGLGTPVAPATFQPSTPSTQPTPSSSTRTGLRLGGMHVNDATAVMPPSSPPANPYNATVPNTSSSNPPTTIVTAPRSTPITASGPSPANGTATGLTPGGTHPPAEPMEISKLPPPAAAVTPASLNTSGLMQWLKSPQPIPTGAAPSW